MKTSEKISFNGVMLDLHHFKICFTIYLSLLLHLFIALCEY